LTWNNSTLKVFVTCKELFMRDPGLTEAIRTAGGVSELARRLGISQPSVSNWERIPADRVSAVATATGLDRAILRPDLFGATLAIDEVDGARARLYGLLAVLLSRAPGAELLDRLAGLKVDASPLGLAQAGLAEAAHEAIPDVVVREYFDLFIGLGRGELMPYGSYYLTGFLHERPLARLRADLAALGIARADDNREPEDHIATLCEVMAGLVERRFPALLGVLSGENSARIESTVDQQVFERHLAPWAGRFFADLEQARAAKFYRTVGTLGRTFTEIEMEAFAMPA
jgi:TorA maturation chaperone TorD